MEMRNVEDLYVASPMQQGLIFHSLYSPSSADYVVQIVCEVEGDLRPALLARAWQHLIDRYPILRTFFVWEGLDEMLQVVRREVELPARVLDWRDLSPEEQQERLRAFVKEDRAQDFDLTQAPLMRLTVIRFGPRLHTLIWSHHHALLDGWSAFLIFRQSFELYEAYARGQELHLAPSRPYRDYIAWLQRQDLADAERFWREKLKGYSNSTQLTAERRFRKGEAAPSATDGLDRDWPRLYLSPETTAALRQSARQHQLTLNTFLMGAWALVLSRYTGEPDAVFGTLVSGRPSGLNGVETMVGPFINLLPLRVKVEGRAPLLPWLKALQAEHAEVRSYDYSPLVQVQAWSDVPRGTPLFETMTVFENYPVDASSLQRDVTLRITRARTLSKTNYPLSFETTPLAHNLLLQISYDDAYFARESVERMLGHVGQVLIEMVARPRARLGELSLLTEAEREQILTAWNETGVAWPDGARRVHDLFDRQSALTPDAVALEAWDERLTYAELSERAGALACHLRRLGVGPDARVGVLMGRCAGMVVALLGALKAGAAYVPLDPEYPRERLRFMADDAGLRVLLTGPGAVDLPGEWAEVRLGASGLPEGGEWGDAACARGEQSAGEGADERAYGGASGVAWGESEPGADNLAYVIYTSGSTGRPKGIAMPHGPLVNLIKWQHADLNLSRKARTLQFSSLSFDASFNEMFANWACGGTLVLIPEQLRRDPPALARFIADEEIDRLFLPFVALQQLAEEFCANDLWPMHLREVLSTAEQLQITEPIMKLFGRLDGCTLYNEYGPSETHVVTAYTMAGEPSGWPALPPIGRPIANAPHFILDAGLQAVPVNVIGELYVGGDALARGYLGRPDLTAEKFIPDPYSRRPGARLYRTGDLARYLPGGNIEYLGRADHQIKLRGFRVEPGEIEALLARHEGVREAVVVAREEPPAGKRLVAYLVAAEPGAVLPSAELRAYLEKKLPPYMIPSAFVRLDALPLTPSGKINRKGLPAPGATHGASETTYVAPRTPVEEIVANVWSAVLGVERIGANDNFFALGGHSLLATQVASRLRQAFSVEVALRSLFESPTVAGLSREIEAARSRDDGRAAPPIRRCARTEPPPLSFAQQRLWLIDQLDPGSPAYNLPLAVRLKGRCDVTALERTFGEIVRRHESLRTTFAAPDGIPSQIIAEPCDFRLHVEDISEFDEGSREAEARRRADGEAARPFDLERGPLFRVALLRLSSDEHVLLLTMHHIVSDGWSMGLLFGEMTALYAALGEGRPSPLEELPVQYADFAVWQRRWLQGEVMRDQLDYWRHQLRDAPVLQLPQSKPRPRVQSYEGASLSFSISRELRGSLLELSREAGASLYMTLLAAFQAMLHRYSGQEQVVVGSPIAGRSRAEVEPLIGFFVNTLALRSDFSAPLTFSQLLSQVREVCLEAYAHQDVPFERLVEELEPERSLSHSPLFQVMFILQNTPAGTLQMAGTELSRVGVGHSSAKYDLTLSISETGEELRALLNYSTALFEGESVERMARHYLRLLENIAKNPDEAVGRLELLDEEERRQILFGWNETRAEWDDGTAGLHDLFERQAALTPDAVAVVASGGQRLTYAQLRDRADALARLLRLRGVGPELRVGVLMSRSPAMVAALLGTLKAGGAYVPLDPEYPRERLRFMAEDAGLRVLVTERRLADLIGEVCGHIVYAEGERWECEGDEACAGAAEPREACADSLAYVIYTSGSTGRPKGVMITHRAICNRLLWMQDAYRLMPSDRVLQKTPFSFDVSVWEFFWPLMTGATLVLARPGGHRDSAYLRDLIIRERITTLHFVPSMLRVFLEEPGVEQCVSLRRVVCSGEALAYELQERFFARSDAGLHNLYGPTEAAVDVTFWDCERGSDRQAVPIGQPIANTQIHILDEYLQPVPCGVPGQLYIGGVGLARGYVKRPALTAERFVPDPFSHEHGARLYCTGDVARRLKDGNIEYLGRADHQIKLRGFRVELGEIEAALRQHEGVGEAVVVAREESAGDKRLIAYVVAASPDKPPAATRLRNYLAARLPEYMIPSAFVRLDALPLTPSGKINRKGLPAPGATHGASEMTYVAPRTPVEEIVAEVWREVLRVERVGAHDNFFALGGHSLLATQVASRIRTLFRVELPLRALFEGPTVARLAAAVEREIGNPRTALTPRIEPVPRDQPPPLSFSQQRLWFLDQLEPGNSAYNIPVALRLSGALDLSALERSIAEIIMRHESLRTTFRIIDDRPAQIVAESAGFSLPVEDISGLDGRDRGPEVRRRAAEEAARPFDLSQGPLLRVRLLRLGGQEHVLLLTMHHIVSDGWSMGLLFGEMTALYAALGEGRPSPLEELPVQYADFAVWQRRWLQGEVMRDQLDYWRHQLRDAPPLLELPADRPRPAARTYAGAAHSFLLPAALADRLARLSRREGVTLYMTLLAAFQAMLHRYSGQEQVVVGSPIAGRSRAEVEPLIGCFINTLALKGDASGNPSFREFLGRVREVCLGAYTHQDLPFELLVDELQPERSLSHSPLFQVMFIFQEALKRDVELPGLMLSALPAEGGTAKFDLTLAIRHDTQGLSGTVEYSTDLFNAETVARMTDHLETLLRAVADNPERRLADLPLLTATEERQLSEEWNATRTDYGDDLALVHDLFERQAARTPGAVALIFGGERLTYAQLDERADALAHHLSGLGVGPESRVGVLMSRSPAMVAALLGTLKAGGAYVPLDPEYPRERLRFMADDAGLDVLVMGPGAEAEFAGEWQEVRLDGAGRLEVEEGRVMGARAGGAAVAEAIEGCKAGPGNLAYVIYTSGSTGRPKGVGVEHRNVVNFLLSMKERPGLSPDDLLLSVTTLCFDIAALELFLPLTVGARVVVAEREATTDAAQLIALLEEHSVTAMQATPATWRMLLAGGWRGRRPRKLMCGGEALSAELAAQLRARSEEVWNLYGPTETTIWSSVERVDEGRERQMIGRAIANTRLYILDARMRLAPLGVTGELYIGGAGVARGYLNRPALTAERFIPDPFSSAPGARLYRTGDVARRLHDGNIEFVGRADRQVKLRGFRVELEEVESALLAHAGVREAVVLARDGAGAARLVAYLVGEGEQRPDGELLRGYLRERLPEYMIPSAFVTLDALPLTPNGKVDRRALPAPDLQARSADDAPIGPRTPAEELLAEVWAQVLGLDPRLIGVNDNFFALGGDSILSVQVVTRANRGGLRLTPRAVFLHPTIAALSKMVDERATTEIGEAATVIDKAATVIDEAASPPIQESSGRPGGPPPPRAGEEAEDAYPLSPMQEVILAQSLSHPHAGVYVPQLVYGLEGEIDPALFARVWERLVERHPVLRTSLVWEGVERPLQVVSKKVSLPFEYHDWRDLPADEQQSRTRRVIDENLRRGFDLARAPLMALSLVRLEERFYRFIWDCHHLLLDGWSCALVLDEFFALYNALSEGQEPVLAPARPYRDYIDWLQRQDTTAAEAFWRQALRGFTRPTRLLIEQPGGDGASGRNGDGPQGYGEQEIELTEETTAGLVMLAREHRLTLNTLVQGAWALTLSHFSGEADVMFGAVVSGRPHELPGVESMVGLFINTLPVRARIGSETSTVAWLQELQAAQAEARRHEQSRPDDVRRCGELPPGEPLFESAIRFQNFPVNPALRARGEGREQAAVSGVDRWHYPLCLVAVPGRRLWLQVSYARRRFGDDAVGAVLAHLRSVLESMSVSLSPPAA